MICQNCKNPIPDNSAQCEWCGTVISINNSKNAINPSSVTNTSSNKANRNLIILPGIIVLLIWIIGNLISERDKYAIFGMDDLSPILILGLILFAVGLIIKMVKK